MFFGRVHFVSAFSAILLFASVSGSPRPSLDDYRSVISKRALSSVVLANGTSMQYAPARLPNGLSWQSSGVLEHGGCTPRQLISDCYELSLTSNPTRQLDPGGATPRQRVEFLTAHQPAGASWNYQWKSYVPSSVTGNLTFFHLMQIFSVELGGPIFFLDIIKQSVYIKDAVAGKYLASANLTAFEDRTLQHTMSVKYGPKGSISYAITDAKTKALVMRFNQTGAVGSGQTYLKFGTYRSAFKGMSPVTAWYGDFVQKQVA